jgi:hypothetical protein
VDLQIRIVTSRHHQVKISPALLFKTLRVIRNNCMNVRKKFPIRLAVGLLIAILIDTAVQLAWKSAVLSLPSEAAPQTSEI